MGERNRFIDVAKGVAIILVLFNHYEWAEGSFVGTHLYNWLVCMAVPIFMLCTGYVTAASFKRNGTDLSNAYTKKALLPKLARYILPVLWFYIAETILTFIFIKTGFLDYLSTLDFAYADGYANAKMTPLGTIAFFFAGGRGQHGTYYFPIILQVAFMMPVIYRIVVRRKSGVVVCFVITLALEVLKIPVCLLLSELGVGSGVQYGIYRLLAFRYIFVLALGCYMYLYHESLGKWYKWLLCFAVGAGYIYLIEYTSYNRVIFTWWQNTSMIAVLYIAPVFLLGLKYLSKFSIKSLEELGKASYHILMVQILYFNFFAPLVWTAPKSVIPNDASGMAISLFVCLGGGYGYYRLYNFVAKKYKEKRHGR